MFGVLTIFLLAIQTKHISYCKKYIVNTYDDDQSPKQENMDYDFGGEYTTTTQKYGYSTTTTSSFRRPPWNSKDYLLGGR